MEGAIPANPCQTPPFSLSTEQALIHVANPLSFYTPLFMLLILFLSFNPFMLPNLVSCDKMTK